MKYGINKKQWFFLCRQISLREYRRCDMKYSETGVLWEMSKSLYWTNQYYYNTSLLQMSTSSFNVAKLSFLPFASGTFRLV